MGTAFNAPYSGNGGFNPWYNGPTYIQVIPQPGEFEVKAKVPYYAVTSGGADFMLRHKVPYFAVTSTCASFEIKVSKDTIVINDIIPGE